MAKRRNSKQRLRRSPSANAQGLDGGLLSRLEGSTIPLLLVALTTGLIIYEAQRDS